MNKRIKSIVIVGGGSAGWLTAGTIAAAHSQGRGRDLSVTLIESASIKILGVGEGTWPSMRDTLRNIGISESEFIRECDVSFKQGSKFTDWKRGAGESYYHPFTLPEGWGEINLALAWPLFSGRVSFAEAVCPQASISEQHLAPKDIATPEYGYLLNYGYHLDAGKFADFLKRHCCSKLGVKHIIADVEEVGAGDNGYITSLKTSSGVIEGDLFIDCTGFASLLIGDHFQVPFIERRNVLFNDTAMAVQVHHQEGEPVASCTRSTARSFGWIWDIGLQSRRGVGYAYSSAHANDAEVERELMEYLIASSGRDVSLKSEIRKITFRPGHREKFWIKNCVAVGVSAGFIEPLEASALVMIELAAKRLAEQMPADFETMPMLAQRFNEKFTYHWQRLIEFLKLHYIMSSREDTNYWRDNKLPESIPESLQQLVGLWRNQPPSAYDNPHSEELFSSASFQYVLYGMASAQKDAFEYPALSENERRLASALLEKNAQQTRRLLGRLPENSYLLNQISAVAAAPK